MRPEPTLAVLSSSSLPLSSPYEESSRCHDLVARLSFAQIERPWLSIRWRFVQIPAVGTLSLKRI
uniref:Putative ovule protein n=1 Tax=Solanum chacoense TaxID=4108 RepID=A0A0V0GHI3_SOLCH